MKPNTFFFRSFISVPILAFGLATTAFFVGPPAQPISKPIVLKAHPWQAVAESAYRQTHSSPAVPDGPTDMIFFHPDAKQIDEMLKWVYLRQHLAYIPESWDCDEIALEWRILTRRWAIDNATFRAPVALSTFVVYIRVEAGAFDGEFKDSGFHALGLLCDSEGTWWFVEPRGPFKVRVLEAYYEGNIQTMKIAW